MFEQLTNQDKMIISVGVFVIILVSVLINYYLVKKYIYKKKTKRQKNQKTKPKDNRRKPISFVVFFTLVRKGG